MAGTTDTGAKILQLDERVTNVSSRLTNLEHTTQQSFVDLGDKIDKLGSEFRQGRAIPWPALGLIFAALTTIGGLVYVPIQLGMNNNAAEIEEVRLQAEADLEDLRDAQDLKVAELRSQQIGLREHERTLEDIAEVRAAVTDLTGTSVTRDGFNLRVGQLEIDINRNSERIDALAESFGGQYTLTDAIQEINDRLDRHEMLINRANMINPDASP
jgi:hypothetical protein